MSYFINTSSIAVVFVTMFGILLHDLHLDRVATSVVAATVPAVYVASTGAMKSEITTNYHTHVERAEIPRFNSTLPRMQPPRDDTRKYQQNKKLFFGGGDALTMWPSV